MDITFFRSALFSVCVLLSGCDSATTPTAPKSAATVLDGKTMGTFWRVSVIGVDEAKAEALRQKVQAQLDAAEEAAIQFLNRRVYLDQLALDEARAGVPADSRARQRCGHSARAPE